MATAVYFDCCSGISGDMTLGALLDAGLSLEALRAELGKLGLQGWTIDAQRGMRGVLSGTRAIVHAPEQTTHRHLADVRAIIEASSLSQSIKERSVAIFTLLAQAEAQVHGAGLDEVHFHEVGALDAIVDIVGVVAGLALLGVEQIYASPLPLGSGWVKSAHGLLPIPAPATLNLLAMAGAPTLPDQTPFELVTPTGAAILAALATFRRPSLRLRHVGYGLGARDLERPNVLRLWFGEILGAEQGPRDAYHRVPSGGGLDVHGPVLLETNIDDQPAEQLGYVVERLFEIGAFDVWLTPIQMKKSRAGSMLAALVPPELEPRAVELLMRETTTLGVRRRQIERYVCERASEDLETPLGRVRVKRKRWAGEEIGIAPEYEDCARLARQHMLPLREIYRIVLEVVEARGADLNPDE